MSKWRLSAGTAGVVGEKTGKTDVLPTTAYIMLGEKCRNRCRFCTQANDSTARAGLLSRVTWPEASGQEATRAIGAAFRAGRLKRACLQVVHGEEEWQASTDALESLTRECPIPVCIAGAIDTVEQAAELMERGVDRICIALDAATPELFHLVKGSEWNRRWELLTRCAATFPGRISTHLIVGLGETEEEMIDTIAGCLDGGITVGLFAFTPVRGTAWEDRQPPSVGQYRRVQIAHFLLKTGCSRADFRYRNGQLTGTRLSGNELIRRLADGKAFETSGCPDCNRPYYNERPGGVMYNYPRALTRTETEQAVAASGIIGIPEQKERGVGHDLAGD